MPTAITPLANITLGSTAANVTFSSISGSYRDLLLVSSAIGTTSGNALLMRFNADSASNFSGVKMRGNGTTTSSIADAATTYLYPASDDYVGIDTASAQVALINIMDYSATDKHKSVLVRGNKANVGVEAYAGRWASTSAITTILLLPGSGSFAAGSSFALYGVSS